MTGFFLEVLLFVVVTAGLLSLLYRDLFVSVILLSVVSFLSALLFYVAHAPDVAITEAAVGAGITTFIFIWAVRASAGSSYRMGKGNDFIQRKSQIVTAVVDIVLVATVGVLLFIFLPPLSEGPTLIRDYLFSHGLEETGAPNLVSAVYLGYRAIDTFGETIVLLCAVSGSIYFLSRN